MVKVRRLFRYALEVFPAILSEERPRSRCWRHRTRPCQATDGAMAVAEPDLRDKLQELKRLKRLEQRRIKRREEKQRKETARLYPSVTPLLPFLDPPPKKPGRPQRTQREIEWDTELAQGPLVVGMHKLKAVLTNNSTVRKTDGAIADRILEQAKLDPKLSARLRTQKGKLPNRDYLRLQIGKFIRSVIKTQLGPAPPGRERWSLRDRAIARILGDKVELASYQEAKLKK